MQETGKVRPMRPIFAAVVMPMALAACVPDTGPKPVPLPPTVSDSCGAGGLAQFIGRPVADLPDAGPWAALRVIKPGMAVTMDYSATRLDAEVDGDGRILKLSCG